jgi:hypothetical protein
MAENEAKPAHDLAELLHLPPDPAVATNLDAEFEDPFLKEPFPDDAGGEKDDPVKHFEPPLLQDVMEDVEYLQKNLEPDKAKREEKAKSGGEGGAKPGATS